MSKYEFASKKAWELFYLHSYYATNTAPKGLPQRVYNALVRGGLISKDGEVDRKAVEALIESGEIYTLRNFGRKSLLDLVNWLYPNDEAQDE